MREILFRGKRIDNGEWVEGYYYRSVGRDLIAASCDHIVGPSTVGMCVPGITDKNGKKIFDGDIVFYYCSDITAVVKFGQYIDLDSPNKPAIGFYSEYSEDGKTVQESMDSRESDQEYGCEVIGNIHDNPELLEVGE